MRQIARRQYQCRRRETQRAEPAMRRADQVAQLTAHQWSGPAPVFARHELVPEGALRIVFDQHEFELDELRNLSQDRLRRRHRMPQPSCSARPRGRARRRQRNPAVALERAQRLQTARLLGAPARFDETKVGAYPICQRGAGASGTSNINAWTRARFRGSLDIHLIRLYTRMPGTVAPTRLCSALCCGYRAGLVACS